ncbi:MAG: hypothetical protein R3E89_07775 [Thiolinea sp.]
MRTQLHEQGVALTGLWPASGHPGDAAWPQWAQGSLLGVAERFVAAGFRCVLVDLPAHGASPLA